MNKMIRSFLSLAILALPAVASAGHSELMVPPSDTFLLGGDQGAAMLVSGKNVGQTGVIILSQSGTSESVIARVSPGGSFTHTYSVGETALIRNQSATETARLSVDFTGSPSNLSMSYALQQEK